jgi:hypothetical protein
MPYGAIDGELDTLDSSIFSVGWMFLFYLGAFPLNELLRHAGYFHQSSTCIYSMAR